LVALGNAQLQRITLTPEPCPLHSFCVPFRAEVSLAWVEINQPADKRPYPKGHTQVPATFATRFRPMLECLEAREVPSATTGDGPPPANFGAAAQQGQSSQMQVNYNGLFNRVAGQQVTVQNGVADVTQAAKSVMESEITNRLPKTFNTPLGEAKLDSVTLNRLTLNKDGNFNGQLTVTYDSPIGKVGIKANITNNQLSLDSDNALVKQFGKLDQKARDWQPKVTQALDAARPGLMSLYFPTTSPSTGR
jgi:hypothetical protein